jgi:serine/threonine-protein kinase
MSLTAGTRLGPYEILSLLGSGGMGEVYRAKDTKLGRDVALKILPDTFTHDPERLARFRREAQVLAALNHPHIGAIYGLDEAGGQQFLVLELVDGESLDRRIARGGPIPVDEALAIAKQIAEALEAAHEKGIIHRDLKPANIALTKDGNIKVLDFGLAKAPEAAGAERNELANSPTITSPAMMTGAGTILGTAAYMSPEQAKGRAADKRSDIWAFGCVIYEMLTGRRPFDGEDVSDTLAAVLRGEPDWTLLPRDLPPAIRLLVQHCLAKDRRQRVGDVAAAQFALAHATGLTDQIAPPAVVPAVPPTPRASVVRMGAGVLLVAAAVALAAWRFGPADVAPTVVRFSFGPITNLNGFSRHLIAISPDGLQLAYAADNRLFVRALAEPDAHAIPGSEVRLALASPAFSPDGRSLAFHSENAIKRISVTGGAPFTVCPADSPFGISWDETGIVFAPASKPGVFRCSPNGGTPEQLAAVSDGEQAQSPQLVANGSALLFAISKITDGNNRWDKGQIVLQNMKSGTRKTLVAAGSDPRYLPTGHLIYAIGGIEFAVAFDPVRQEVIGAAVPVLQGVRRTNVGGIGGGAAQLATSRTGTLMYLAGPVETASDQMDLVIADRSGTQSRLPVQTGPYVHVRASGDGRRLAVGSDDGAKEAIVWIYDLAGTSTMRRLTIGDRSRFPIWSADGERVAFQSDREGDLGIFLRRSDGSGPIERLTKAAEGEAHIPESWSPDGTHVLFSVQDKSKYVLWSVSVVDQRTEAFGHVESAEPIGAVFSPDGRWIAYASSPKGGGIITSERGVFIQPFPATGNMFQAPRQRLDFHPLWASKGTELIYIPSAVSGQMTVVSVATQPTVSFGKLTNVPARVTARRGSSSLRAHDILPDGRFVGFVPVGDSDPTDLAGAQIRVVLNWFEELKARVPTR